MENKRQNIEYRILNIESKMKDSVFLEFNPIPHSPFNIQHSTFHLPHSPRTRGISLLELLIYIALLSGLMVIVSDAFIMLSKGRGQAEARSEINSAIRFAGEIIKQDVKNATAVSAPLLGVPGSTLTLTVSGDTILYEMSGGTLRRKVNAGTPEAVTGGYVTVDVPTFTRIENHNSIHNATTTAIQVAMTMRYNAVSGDWTYEDSLRTSVTFR